MTWSAENRRASCGKREAEVVRGVAGRLDRLETPARRRDRVARRASEIGRVVAVGARLERVALAGGQRARGAMGAAADDRARRSRPGRRARPANGRGGCG